MFERLLPAFHPCGGFASPCTTMRWIPEVGHVPRGFCGAEGGLEDVRLVMVTAEPGDPYDDENHDADGTPEGRLRSSMAFVRFHHEQGRDRYHVNFRDCVDRFWPGLSFADRMKRTWITDSVLCSAEKEMGAVPMAVELHCARTHLLRQLALFPRATVVALGNKAQQRLRQAGVVDFLAAGSPAPPGGNQDRAHTSWSEAAAEFRRRQGLPPVGDAAAEAPATGLGLPRSLVNECLGQVPGLELDRQGGWTQVRGSVASRVMSIQHGNPVPQLHLRPFRLPDPLWLPVTREEARVLHWGRVRSRLVPGSHPTRAVYAAVLLALKSLNDRSIGTDVA